jgi:hypothetical protein
LNSTDKSEANEEKRKKLQYTRTLDLGVAIVEVPAATTKKKGVK